MTLRDCGIYCRKCHLIVPKIIPIDIKSPSIEGGVCWKCVLSYDLKDVLEATDESFHNKLCALFREAGKPWHGCSCPEF